MRVAVVGSTGFVGSAIEAELAREGHETIGVRAPRLCIPSVPSKPTGHSVFGLIDEWMHSPEATDARGLLEAAVIRADCVVNAAGLAEPNSRLTGELMGANAALAAIIASVAGDALRVVHISSAAVHAGAGSLSDAEQAEPNSSYGLTKAVGESFIRRLSPQSVVYRAVSVQGSKRPMTRSLCRLVDFPLIPLADPPQPMPLATIGSTTSAVRFLVENEHLDGTFTHPQGLASTENLVDLLSGRGRRVGVPVKVGRGFVRLISSVSDERLIAHANRLELLLSGRLNAATRLNEAGWASSETFDEYRRMARDSRAAGRDDG